MRVYPNPFKDQLTIENEKGRIYDLAVTSIEGKQVFAIEDLGEREVLLQTKHLKKGVYFLRFRTKEMIYSKKVIRQ